MSNKIERRMVVAEFRVNKEDAAKPRLEGYASVFNSDSEDLGGYREQIKPGAFKRTLAENADVRALKNHDPNFVLGRTKSGTLRLSEDAHGLKMSCDMPDTSYARDLMTSVERGDIDQMSFGFYVRGSNWMDEKGQLCDAYSATRREITDAELFDVSAVTYPAYQATSLEARHRMAFNFPEGQPDDRTKKPEVVVPVVEVEPTDLTMARLKTRLAEIN